jgi:carbon storage regulator CsrA
VEENGLRFHGKAGLRGTLMPFQAYSLVGSGRPLETMRVINMQARKPRTTDARDDQVARAQKHDPRDVDSTAGALNARRRSMLVLTRRVGESICIGDDVEVRIVEARGGKVRLAIEAPREVNVRRAELPPRGVERIRLAEDEPGQRRAVS